MFSESVTIIGIGLMVLLLTRAIQGGVVPRLPFFYSYIAYVLVGELVTLTFLYLRPTYYPTAYWFYFLLSHIVEFAVLLEVSDHIFEPYPAVRSMGRLLCTLICGVFLTIYIVPFFIERIPSNRVWWDLVKYASLTKALIILILLASVRFYKLSLGRSITGILLGFSIYLGVSIANFELAETYGGSLYAPIFRLVLPLSWTLGALVWVVALWNYEPSVVAEQRVRAREQKTPALVDAQLARFNDTLLKLMQR